MGSRGGAPGGESGSARVRGCVALLPSQIARPAYGSLTLPQSGAHPWSGEKGLNRLSHATGNYEKTALVPENSVLKKFEHGYSYVQNGNLTAKTVYDPESGAVDDAWTYQYSNHAATRINTTRAGARFTMQYDAAGNMTHQSDATKTMAKEMAYDSYNRIRQVTDPSTGTVKGRYSYDDQGFRVWRKALMEVGGQERHVELLYPSMYFSMEILRDAEGVLIEDSGLG